MGPKLVSRYAARRFALFEPEVQTDLFGYLYSVYGQPGSGEYCLAHILSPGAFARWPLITRIKQLKGDIPVSFGERFPNERAFMKRRLTFLCVIASVYGDSDWMDKNGGREISTYLKNRAESSPRQKQQARVYVNEHAGHWTFLE
jgi:cardiolipin-specific phospholipase